MRSLNKGQGHTSRPSAVGAGVLAMVAALILSSCSNLFDSGAKTNKPIRISGASGACTKELGANMKRWLSDGSTDVAASVDCAVEAIDEFTAHVEGQSQGFYTRGELTQFLGTYLASAGSSLANDADGWTREAMKMKQLAFGGTTETVGKDEVARVRAFLLRAKPVLVSVTPHIKTIFFHAESPSVEESAAASKTVEDVMGFLGREFVKSVAERPTTTPQAMLDSAHRLGIDSEKIDSWVPLAEAVKAIVVGGDRQKVRAEEWTPLLNASGRVWALAIRAKYDVWKNDQWLDARLSSTEALINGVVGLLEEGVRNHENGILLPDWENAITALADKSLLPKGLTAATAKKLLPIFFGKFLYGVSNPDFAERSVAFSDVQLQAVKDEVRSWILGQKIILGVFANRKTLAIDDLVGLLGASNLVSTLSFAATDVEAGARTQRELLRFVKEGRPLIHDSSDRLVILPRAELPPMSKGDLQMINLIRLLAGSALSGWTHDRDAALRGLGLLESEALDIYVDLREFGHEMGLIDTRNNTAGIRTFMEAGIFTSMSDGNDRLDLREGVEWFEMVLAGGHTADGIYSEMLAAGCGVGTKDVLGREKLDINCFRRQFLLSFAHDFPNLPQMVEWTQADSSGERARQLLQALEGAGRNRGLTQDPLDSSEFRAMVPILQYTESLFARHDVDHSGVLENNEIWNAFPILQPFIRKMANGKADDPEMQKAIFSYLLKFGEPPAPTLIDTGKLLAWRLIHGWFKDSASRLDVLKVMGSFAKAGKQTRVQNIKAFLSANKSGLRQKITQMNSTTLVTLTDLFQCRTDASSMVGEALVRNIQNILPSPDVDPDQFINSVKAALGADPRLTTQCLPF